MNKSTYKCSFCDKVEAVPEDSKNGRPTEWITIVNKGYTNLYACEQCARLVLFSHVLTELSKPHRNVDISFLQSYFPDLKKLEDTDK